MKKLKIAVSACLMGFKYRYDGKADLFQELIDNLKDSADFIPVCPEMECGMPVPRPKIHIRVSQKGTRLIVTETGEDVTDMMTEWAANKLEQLAMRDVDAFFLHSRSPSCGLETTKLFSADSSRMLHHNGTGIFAAMVKKRFPRILIGNETNFPDFLCKLHVLAQQKGIAL